MADALVGRLMNQLEKGCGRRPCDNPNCAGFPGAPQLSKKEALTKALSLVKADAQPCPPLPNAQSSSSTTTVSSSTTGPAATPAISQTVGVAATPGN
jgi:hypothetical protein